MSLGVLDWLVVCIPVVLVTLIALKTRRHTRSVADFMSASRVAGRYLVATAQGEASFGAANIVGAFEMFFLAGFTYGWWLTFNNIVWLFILLSGMVIYRYRESRVMTLAQFFEIRYSKAFRIFAGVLVFASGLLAYGIYPAIGARFFVYFCGFPTTIHLLGFDVQTFVPVMIILLTPGVLLTTMGGQLTLMVVDCVEGIISLVFYVCIATALLYMFSWSDISGALQQVPEHQSRFNPFDSEANSNFGFWYALIAIFINAYGWQSSQVGHGFRSAAINAHEQKMGAILGPWRNEVRGLMTTVLCICAIAFVASPTGAAAVGHALESFKGTSLEAQLRTPTALGLMLPPVIRGMFAAIMLFAIISTDCTMMHSWGTIFVQDIVVPLKKPMEPAQHVNLLRCAVVGVATFAFLFSWLLPQTTYINMFLAITGAITAGLGACILGGFYWKRGTTAAAWAAMISGALVSVVGEAATQTWRAWLYPWLSQSAPGFLQKANYILHDVISATIPNLNWNINPSEFFLNRMWIGCFAVLAAIFSYLAATFFTYRKDFNLDRMLHRGQYAIAGEHVGKDAAASAMTKRRFSFKMLVGITPEFTRADLLVSLGLFVYRIAWFVVFVVITIWNIPASWRWPEQWWINYWHVVAIYLPCAITSIMVVWFTWGGLKDIRELFIRLRTVECNPLDDGTVADHRSVADTAEAQITEDAAREPVGTSRRP